MYTLLSLDDFKRLGDMHWLWGIVLALLSVPSTCLAAWGICLGLRWFTTIDPSFWSIVGLIYTLAIVRTENASTIRILWSMARENFEDPGERVFAIIMGEFFRVLAILLLVGIIALIHALR